MFCVGPAGGGEEPALGLVQVVGCLNGETANAVSVRKKEGAIPQGQQWPRRPLGRLDGQSCPDEHRLGNAHTT